MKICFKIIKAGSGNDVYFQRLSKALKTINIDSEIVYFSKLFQFFPFLLRLVNKASTADIIHSNVEYGWAFKEKNKPLYVTLHHNIFDPNYRKDTSLLQRIFHDFILKPNIQKTLKVAYHKIAVSSYTKESFTRTFSDDNIKVIYNFIDTCKYRPLKTKSDGQNFRLLFVGNLTYRKGADLLPKIMRALGPYFVLYYTSGLRTTPPKKFDLPNMIPLGKLSEDQLISEYQKCDALLFPTRFEGFGYCVAEAMSCGKPVIASNCSSIPELITNYENGILPPKNDIGDFVRAVSILAGNKSLARKISLNNPQKVFCKFNLESTVDQYRKIYEKSHL